MQEIIALLAAAGPLKIAASAFIIFMVGALWTSPLLFGKSWMRLSGIRIGDMRPAQMMRLNIYGVIVAIITAILLGLFATHANGDSPMLFSGVAFIWLFIMLQQFMGFAWRREPFALFLLVTLRCLAMLMAGAAVYYFWR